MISLLSRLFVKNRTDYKNEKVRTAYGTLCGGVGICLNIILFAAKLLAGTLSGAIAITADAFNNLSDAGSSLISLVGIRLAGKKPDPEHPFGHGRFEYITGLIVSIAILLMGFELGKSSFAKILHPEDIEFSLLTAILLIAAILVKLYMMLYNSIYGKKIDSVVLKATAKDSMSDMISTSAVLLATFIGAHYGIKIDGYCGIIVAALILYTGFSALKDTVAPLLGEPPAPEFIKEIEDIVLSHNKIVGMHDLIVHNYGPGRSMISLHAEVPANCDIVEMHDIIDHVELELAQKTGAAATIHMDPIVTNDERINTVKAQIAAIIAELDGKVTFHDFRMVDGPTHTNIIFDIVVPFKYPISDEDLNDILCQKIYSLNPTYNAVIQIDKDYNNIL